jgi:hypothetical protein
MEKSLVAKGITPVIEVYFARDHSKRYALIGACDVLPAYELVERECSGMDSDPEQGTVDMVCFE